MAALVPAPEPVVPPVPTPVPESLSALRLLQAYRSNVLPAYPARAYEEPVMVRPFFGRTSFLINAPEDIRRVLIDNDAGYGRTRATIRIIRPLLGEGLFLATGEAWKRQRRVSAPAFAPKAVPAFARAAAEAVELAAGRAPIDARGTLDLMTWLQHLTLDVAGRALLSTPMAPWGAALRRLILDYGLRFGRPSFLDFFLPVAVPTPRDLRRRRLRGKWLRAIDGLIAERSGRTPSQDGPADLFDMLTRARDPESGAALFDAREIRDQVATMILAGHETTAVALFWACYLLALAPFWQDRLAEEAAGLDLGPERAAQALGRLVVARAVVDEALRLYPPAFIIVRQALAEDRLAGREVPRGSVVMIAPWVLHRHRRLWTRPDAFDPGRFLPGAPACERFAFLPFGAGPRVCIGAPLATTEATIVLASLAQRFRIGLVDDRPVMPVAVITTQPDHAALFRLTPR